MLASSHHFVFSAKPRSQTDAAAAAAATAGASAATAAAGGKPLAPAFYSSKHFVFGAKPRSQKDAAAAGATAGASTAAVTAAAGGKPLAPSLLDRYMFQQKHSQVRARHAHSGLKHTTAHLMVLTHRFQDQLGCML